MKHLDELLSAFLDGEVTAEERRTVTNHLDECGRCRVELEEVRGARASVRGLAMLEGPELAGLARTRRRRLPDIGRYKGVAAVAASVLVLFAGVLAVSSGPSPEPVPAADLAVLLAAYSNGTTKEVSPMVPATTAEAANSGEDYALPEVAGGIPRHDVRGWGDGGTVAYYGMGKWEFVLLYTHDPLNTDGLVASDVPAEEGVYMRGEGEGSVMYVWEAETGWMALLGVLPEQKLTDVLADLPRPTDPGLFTRLWRTLTS